MSTLSVRAVWAALVTGAMLVEAGAEENLLGLPAPRDGRRPGAIVLHGGGRITGDVFQRFVALAGGRQARIVFIPCAGYRPSDYDSEEEFEAALSRRYSSWVQLAEEDAIDSFEFLYTDDPDDADDPDFVAPLEAATGVWFCGGWQSRLNYRFVGEFPTQTRFQIALRRVVERGGVVGGTSAGMAALPEIMTLWQERDDTSGSYSAVAAHGLGLLKGAIVEQHFDTRGGRLERFTGLLRDSEHLDTLADRRGAGDRMTGLAVEEPAALVLRGNQLEVLGAGSAHIFLKSDGGRTVVWHELRSGDLVEMRRDKRGTTTLERQQGLSQRNADANRPGEIARDSRPAAPRTGAKESGG